MTILTHLSYQCLSTLFVHLLVHTSRHDNEKVNNTISSRIFCIYTLSLNKIAWGVCHISRRLEKQHHHFCRYNFAAMKIWQVAKQNVIFIQASSIISTYNFISVFSLSGHANINISTILKLHFMTSKNKVNNETRSHDFVKIRLKLIRFLIFTICFVLYDNGLKIIITNDVTDVKYVSKLTYDKCNVYKQQTHHSSSQKQIVRRPIQQLCSVREMR